MKNKDKAGLWVVLSVFAVLAGANPAFSQVKGNEATAATGKAKPAATIPPPPLPPSAYGYSAGEEPATDPSARGMVGTVGGVSGPVPNPQGYYSAPPQSYYPVTGAAVGTVGTPAPPAPSPVPASAGMAAAPAANPAPAADPADPCSQFRTQDGYAACQDRMMKIGRMQDAKKKRQEYSQDIAKRLRGEGGGTAAAAAETGTAAAGAEGAATPAATSSSGTQGVTDQMILDALKKLQAQPAPATTETDKK